MVLVRKEDACSKIGTGNFQLEATWLMSYQQQVTKAGHANTARHSCGDCYHYHYHYLTSRTVTWGTCTEIHARVTFPLQFLFQTVFGRVEWNLRPTVSRPVCLGVGPPLEAHDQILHVL
jgi:hypothetical protein